MISFLKKLLNKFFNKRDKCILVSCVEYVYPNEKRELCYSYKKFLECYKKLVKISKYPLTVTVWNTSNNCPSHDNHKIKVKGNYHAVDFKLIKKYYKNG